MFAGFLTAQPDLVAVSLEFVPPRGFEYHPLHGDAGRNLNKNMPESMFFLCAPSRICSEPPSPFPEVCQSCKIERTWTKGEINW